jgi:hypothetical protein
MSDEAVTRQPTDLLNRLCKQGEKLTATPQNWEFGLPLQFWTLEKDRLVVKLLTDVSAEQVPVGTPIWAIFENLGRPRTFRSRVLEHIARPDGRPAAWKIEIPTEVASEDRRRAFRVPAIVPGSVIGNLKLGNNVWNVEIRNLSVVGALIRLPAAVADVLPDDGKYYLNLDAGEDGQVEPSARLIRRGGDGRLAFHFPRSVKMGEVKPSSELVKVVRAAELAWLRKRSGVDEAA